MSTGKALQVSDIRDMASNALQDVAKSEQAGTTSWDNLLDKADVGPLDLILLVEDFKGSQHGLFYYLVPVAKPDGSIPVVLLLDAITGDLLEYTAIDDTEKAGNAVIIRKAKDIINDLNAVGWVEIEGVKVPVAQVTIEDRLVWHYSQVTPLPYFPFYQMHVEYKSAKSGPEQNTFYVPISGFEITPGEIPDLTPYESYPGKPV